MTEEPRLSFYGEVAVALQYVEELEEQHPEEREKLSQIYRTLAMSVGKIASHERVN